MKNVKAIGFTEHLPINDSNSLFEFNHDVKEPVGHDLLVKVQAVSVNPVDVSVRGNGRGTLKNPKIIGWDAYGIVQAVGDEAKLFKPGDKVFYAGDFKRSGSNSEYQLVDERIVGNAPKNVSVEQAAAMPLTSLTAYEALFEKMQIDINNKAENQKHNILIINGAGGVGSIATQLAHLAGLNVIATASRLESIKWTKENGAELVLNHRKNLVDEYRKKTGKKYVDYILELNDIDGHWNEMCELIKPSGIIGSITENHRPINLRKLTKKRGTFTWEWMYSKSYYQTDDMRTQHDILNKIAKMLDDGEIRSTLTQKLSPINSINLREAHKLVESHHMIGKVVLSGWN